MDEWIDIKMELDDGKEDEWIKCCCQVFVFLQFCDRYWNLVNFTKKLANLVEFMLLKKSLQIFLNFLQKKDFCWNF